MHEIARQEYLSALGIDTYIPRWKISFAHTCEQTFDIEPEQIHLNNDLEIRREHDSPPIDLRQVLDGIVEKVVVKKGISSSLQPPENSQTIQPFSVSIWRPESGFLIVSARNTEAMPTELLLNNFLRFYLQQNQLVLNEEVLRWPATENKKMTLTEQDACTELQTWLSVQHEFQPIKNLWFFGDVSDYFIPERSIDSDKYIKECNINLNQNNSSVSSISVKFFPDLSQFLLHPELKFHLLSLM
jgi:hypothetical protein